MLVSLNYTAIVMNHAKSTITISDSLKNLIKFHYLEAGNRKAFFYKFH